MVTVNVTEGTVPFSHPNLPAGVKCETWYRIVGTLPGPGTKALPPLITLHGGPGVGHLYLPPTFDRLASSASTISAGGELSTPRAVIYYDQVGAGRSTHLRQTRLDVSVWTVELFVAELDNLIRHLGLTESETPGFDLFGHSWGSILAVSFATADPAEVPSVKGLRRLVAASGPASMPLWQVATRGLLAKMPAEVREAIEKGEKEKNYESEEYEAAILEFYKVHLCRLWPFPDALSEAFGELQKDDTVYMTMNGPSEITVVGSLKTLDLTKDLHKINVPTLVINGEFDEATDLCVEPFFKNISKVKWVQISGGAHMAHLEFPDRYLAVLRSFLTMG